ncbi:MAG: hypothetical protein VXW87_01330 [Pseudomonadota bacterium]|nr:hypothetical protein [Pseudomonadota bacterium]
MRLAHLQMLGLEDYHLIADKNKGFVSDTLLCQVIKTDIESFLDKMRISYQWQQDGIMIGSQQVTLSPLCKKTKESLLMSILQEMKNE